MQYHNNIGKEDGQGLYASFVTHCEKELSSASKCAEAGTEVKHGTYGNRQVLKLDTNGPYTHLMEFWELNLGAAAGQKCAKMKGDKILSKCVSNKSENHLYLL